MQNQKMTLRYASKQVNPKWNILDFYRFLRSIHFINDKNSLTEEWIPNLDVEIILDNVPNIQLTDVMTGTGFLIDQTTLNYFKKRYNEQTAETKKVAN